MVSGSQRQFISSALLAALYSSMVPIWDLPVASGRSKWLLVRDHRQAGHEGK